MERRPIIIIFFLFYSLAIFGGGYWIGQTGWPLAEFGVASSQVPPAAADVFDPFWEAWNLINGQYYDQPVDPTTLTEGAIEGMLASLEDPHTRYLPPALEESARQNMEGELEGIGVLVEMVDGRITIVSPFEGSPADDAGLQPGDILLAADGQDLAEMDLGDAADLIRGPAGTTVSLTIQRDDEIFEVDVQRDVIRIPSVRGEMLEGDIAYIRLSRFGNRTKDELHDTLDTLLAENPQGLILDLRNNPGGGLESAVDVADEFLSEGVILIERFGSNRERIFESSDRGMAEEIPMVVLINEGSASASEVLAGAIRDRERGILIGKTTFGKGTVQTWHSLSNGGGVRITTARWLTPAENWVHGTGLTPDIVVELPEGEPGEDFEDTQLDAATDYLRSQEQVQE